MGDRLQPEGAWRALLVVATALLAAGCQGMDRLEPDERIDLGGGTRTERGTVFSDASGTRGGGLTAEIYQRALREITITPGEERLRLAEEVWSEYPETRASGDIHELVGDAYSGLGRHEEAARAWERAIEMSWPAPDLLRLPLSNVQLPYEVGWAHYQAGAPQLGADWLVRATFISDRPQLDQGLRFLYAELDAPQDSFERWYGERRAELAVEAPDFELPGYQMESLRFSEAASRLTLINFWTPT